FNFIGITWDVNRAKEILSRENPHREIFQLPVQQYKVFLSMIGRAPAGRIDLTVPVICVKILHGWLPIDGWNRIGKAISQNDQTILAVGFTAREEMTLLRKANPLEVPSNF